MTTATLSLAASVPSCAGSGQQHPAADRLADEQVERAGLRAHADRHALRALPAAGLGLVVGAAQRRRSS